MDEARIDLQVLSLAALGFDALDASTATTLSHDVNDELAAAVRTNPSRLAAFASLALKDPESAAKEFEHSIQKLGFRGVLLDGTTEGLFLDDSRFTPIFPVYLHPAPPPEPVFEAYFTGFPEGVGSNALHRRWGKTQMISVSNHDRENNLRNSRECATDRIERQRQWCKTTFADAMRLRIRRE